MILSVFFLSHFDWLHFIQGFCFLQDDIFCIFIYSHPFKRGMTHHAVCSNFGKTHFTNKIWFHPGCDAWGGFGLNREGLLTSGILQKGGLLIILGLNCRTRSFCISTLKPVPILPVYFNFPLSKTPTSNELKYFCCRRFS